MGPVNLRPSYSDVTYMNGDIDMGNKRIRRLAPGVLPTDAVNLQQLQDNVPDVDTSTLIPKSVLKRSVNLNGETPEAWLGKFDYGPAPNIAVPGNKDILAYDSFSPSVDFMFNLGQDERRWLSIYGQTAEVDAVRTGKVQFPNGNTDVIMELDANGDLKVDTDIVPAVTDFFDLGTEAKRFKSLTAQTVYVDDLVHLIDLNKDSNTTGFDQRIVFPETPNSDNATVTVLSVGDGPTMTFTATCSNTISTGDIGKTFSNAYAVYEEPIYSLFETVPYNVDLGNKIWGWGVGNSTAGYLTRTTNNTEYYGQWFQMKYSTAIRINKYGWKNVENGTPHTWAIFGSNDNNATQGTWTALQTRGLMHPTDWTATYTYTFSNSTKYKYYRVVVLTVVTNPAISDPALGTLPTYLKLGGPVFFKHVPGATPDDLTTPVVSVALSAIAPTYSVMRMTYSVSDNSMALGEIILYLSTNSNASESAIRAGGVNITSPVPVAGATRDFTGLSDYTEYYGYVLASDLSGNQTITKSTVLRTTDHTAPLIQSDGPIVGTTISQPGSTTITIDNITASDSGVGLVEVLAGIKTTAYGSQISLGDPGVASVPIPTLSFIGFSGLNAGTTYYTVLQAKDASNNYLTVAYPPITTDTLPIMSGSTTSASSYFLVETIPPTSSNFRIRFKALAGSGSSVAHYYLFVGTGSLHSPNYGVGASLNIDAMVGTAFGNALSVDTATIAPGNTALEPGTAYFVYMTVVDGHGNVAQRWSNVNTSSLPTSTLGTITAHATTFSVPWTAAAGGDAFNVQTVSNVYIYCDLAANTVPSTTAAFIASAKTTALAAGTSGTASITGLTASTSYKVQLLVKDSGGNYKFSSVVTQSTGALPVATLGTITATSTTFSVPWTASDVDGISNVYIYCDLAANTVPSDPTSFIASAKTTALTAGTSGTASITGLTAGASYKVQLLVKDTATDYGFSNVVTQSTTSPTSVKYPPANLTSSTTTLSGQSYGNGTYTVTRSEAYAPPNFEAWMAFSNALPGGWGGWLSVNGTTWPKWIILELPTAITLTSFKLYSARSGNSQTYYGPEAYSVSGMVNTTETQIYSTSSSTWTAAGFNNNNGEAVSVTTVTVTPGTSYNKYKINITSGSPTPISFGINITRWELYGY